MKVFVYGTLMKKYWNHYFLEGKICIGEGKLKGYEMYHVSSFPGIVESKQNEVLGEVYEIDEETLKRLDRLEAAGIMYIRKEESVIVNGEEIKAFVYVWNESIKGCEKVKEMPWKPKEWG